MRVYVIERARSLPPTKDSPSDAGTPGSLTSKIDSPVLEEFTNTRSLPQPILRDPPMEDAPRKVNGTLPELEAQVNSEAPKEMPQPPSKPQALSQASPSAAIAPSRAGSLLWQQRPSSRGSAEPKSRPLSSLTSEDSAASLLGTKTDSAISSDGGVSRNQIAQSLDSKDPSWFKQTQDRGLGSAAFRKDPVEDSSNTRTGIGTIRLPGLARERTMELEGQLSPPAETIRSASLSTEVSTMDTSLFGTKTTISTAASSIGGVRSPIPTVTSQRLEPPSSDTSSSQTGEESSVGRGLAMSPSQGRLSPERIDRPASPTKGLGGFVQSAMMKRSDSVYKRWSAQASPGLNRGSSIASNRSGYDAPKLSLGGIAPLGEPKPAIFSRESTPASTSSRPGSSHSNATVTPSQHEDEKRNTAHIMGGHRPSTPPYSGTTKPIPAQDQQLPPSSIAESKSPGVMSPPMSPSKRWSPQKSSWLENAINKPESPKVLSPATTSQQPSWMAGIARAKQQRGSVDATQAVNHKQISTASLMRSPPPGTGFKPPSIGGLPSGFSANVRSTPMAGGKDDPQKGKYMSDYTASGDIEESNILSLTASGPTSRARNAANSSKDEIEHRHGSSAEPLDDKHIEASVPSPKPSTVRPKPDTPPKNDFKSSLKSRPMLNEAQTKDEPEFKNVFGKLKRTQTQNYKAPDEFKDNIMRGRAALAVTEGPRKTERKDELKESILKKKQGMVAPSASTKIISASSRTFETTTPEAIKKREGLTRSPSFVSNGTAERTEDGGIKHSEAPSKLESVGGKPKPITSQKVVVLPAVAQKQSCGDLGANFASSLAGILQRGPSPISAPSKNEKSISHSHDLAAGPKLPAVDETAPQNGPQLTHTTKSRARGPKRKPPSASQQGSTADAPCIETAPFSNGSVSGNQQSSVKRDSGAPPPSFSASKTQSRALSNITNSNNNNNRKTSQPRCPRKPSTTITQPPKIAPAAAKPQLTDEIIKPNPTIETESASPVVRNVQGVSKSSTEVIGQPPLKETNDHHEQRPPSSAPSSLEHEARRASAKDAAALWGHLNNSPRIALPKSPIKLPTQQDKEATVEQPGLNTIDAGTTGVDASCKPPQPRSPKPNVPSSSVNSPKSPPLLDKKPTSIPDPVPSNAVPSSSNPSTTSRSSRTSHAAEIFADIFDRPPSSKGSINIDTQHVLDTRSSCASFSKVKTLRKQIIQIVDNGKMNPVPTHEEHILFEDSLYLCTHVFGTPAGQRTTEVYLWCGDGVSPSTAEDAQLFAKKVAKESNGKLIVLKQGKETSTFFQALGGIVITRRGSGSVSRSAPYMLCGRQHVGQIAFDEVEFGSHSLCSGFPYIISARSGKLYLWKGKGAEADELGCARLIGMDLGLTGEIEEIDEGKEPEDFWAAFPDSASTTLPEKDRAQYWHRKSSCETYTTRLFAVDTEAPRPKSASNFMPWGRRGSAPSTDANGAMATLIKEITPFSHADVVGDNIFVLDAFFEIFV